jgi:hypothetical protein
VLANSAALESKLIQLAHTIRRWWVTGVLQFKIKFQHFEAVGADLYLDRQNVDATTPTGRLL